MAMLVNLFLLLAGYYLLKTLREPLILTEGGAEMKSYAAAAQALSLMGFVRLYGWFVARVDRLRLVVGAVLFSLAMIAQVWSYANDIYRRDAGVRLFPFLGWVA